MAAGLMVWDANGNVVLAADHRVMRIISVKQLTGGLNESVQSDAMKQGAFISFQPDSYIGWLSGGLIHPSFGIDTSTGTISWTWAAKQNGNYDQYQQGLLVYGAW